MAQRTQEEVEILHGLKSVTKRLFYLVINFLKYYFTYIYILIIIVIGFLVFNKFFPKENYKNEIIVIQNFDSENYLYKKIKEIDDKITFNDSLFLKQVFGKEYNEIKSIEIEAIDDVYSFKSKVNNGLEIYKTLSSNGDAVDNLVNYQNSVYFKYHSISFITNKKLKSTEPIDNLFVFLNNNEHFNNYAKIYRENLKYRIDNTNKTLSQINNILDNYKSDVSDISSQNVININSSLDELIREKNALTNALLPLSIELEDADQTIKPINYSININPDESMSTKLKVFILSHVIYLIILLIIYSFKNKSRLINFINENK